MSDQKIGASFVRVKFRIVAIRFWSFSQPAGLGSHYSLPAAPPMSGAVAQLAEGLRIRGGLKESDLANITHVSQATVSRWAAGKAAPQPKTQIVISDLRYVVDRLAEFYSPDETRIWLYARHPLLDGANTINLIGRGGADPVLAVIDSLSSATFT